MSVKNLGTLVERLQSRQMTAATLARQAECAKEVDLTYSTINKNQEEYDKQLLTLSSAFLALSLAFTKDVVPFNVAIHKWLLYSSFVVLSLCVLGVLTSYQISIEGLFRAKAYWEEVSSGNEDAHFPFGFAKWVRRFNRSTGVLFLLGIVLTVSFVITNLHLEATMEKKNSDMQEGQEMKTPSKVEKGAHLKVPAPTTSQDRLPKQQPVNSNNKKPE